jgi:hypothetical protein
MGDFGYHTQFIERGEYGQFSKIREEFEELKDAWETQENKVLAICELCDLYGAIEAFAQESLNMSMDDIIQFSDLTKEVYSTRPKYSASI